MNENETPSTDPILNEGAETPTRPSVRPMFERVHPAGHTGRNTLPPSLRANRFDTEPVERPRNLQGAAHGVRRAAPRNHKIATRNKRFAALYIFALVVVIAGFMTLFVLYLPDILDRTAQTDDALPAATEPTVVIPPDVRNLTAQIVRVTPAASSIEVVNINTGTRHELTHTESTQMTNIRGDSMVFEQLAIGQLVDISFEARTNQLMSAHQSRNAWERRNQTNLRFDTENETITAGNAVFTFDPENTMVLYRGQHFSINNLQSSDMVTIFGYGEHVWLIQLDAGHGFLQLLNTDHVLGGIISVGFDSHALVGVETLQLQEGTHEVVVRGQNIEDFVRTIEVIHGQTLNMNLNETILRRGTLSVEVIPDDALVFVNGERVTGPIELEFGEYLMRVERADYIAQEQMINMNAESVELSVELESAIRMGILRVTTVPANAQIFVNNQFVGFSELFHELQVGHYSVIARLAGHYDSPITVAEVTQDGTEIVIILTPTYVPTWPPPATLPPAPEEPAAPTLPPFMQPPPG
ncbi:MAG: hypothetical protein FWC71_00670 [Defluviitaleaceae bacterium]|nr:hypothetical protein [Defluviitaleaceae bacterium]